MSTLPPRWGMVIDLKYLKSLVNEEIVLKIDHKNINVDVDFMKGIIPTAENIAIRFWDLLEPKINNKKNAVLHEIRLFESERNYVVYRGKSYERFSTSTAS